MKNAFFLPLLALLLLLARSSSAQTASARAEKGATKPVTLKLWGAWGIPDPESPRPDPANTAVLRAFQTRHPEIRLQIASGLKLSGPAAESGLLMAMAGGTGPDVVYVNMRQLATYTRQGFLLPLDEYLGNDPTALRDLPPALRDALRVDGHYYSYPWTQDNMALYYRKDLFRAAGLDPDAPPADWDAFYEAAKRLTDPSKGQYGTCFQAESQGTAWHWTNFLWQAGGEVMRPNAHGKWESAFDTPEGAVALNFYRKLLLGAWTDARGKKQRGVAIRTTDTETAYINRGKIGMWLSSQSNLAVNQTPSEVNPALIGVAPLPAGPGGRRATMVNAAQFGVSALQKDPAVRRAAWELVRFLGSEEANLIRTRSAVEQGTATQANPKYLEKAGCADLITSKMRREAQVREEMLPFGKPEPYGGNAQLVYSELDQPLQEAVLYPDRDAHTILHKASERMNAKLFGYTDPALLKRQRQIALGAVTGGFAVVIGLTVYMLRLLMASPAASVGGRTGRRQRLIAAVLMAPALLSVAVWAYYPLARGLLMAFQDYRIAAPARFIGFDNFIEAATQETFWLGIWHSFEYVGLSLALGFFLPVFLAVLLTEIPRGKVLFRTLYYLPAVTSGLVIFFLWKQFYDPSPAGLLNTLCTRAGGFWNALAAPLYLPAAPAEVAINWLGDPKWAMLAVVLPGIWASAGPGSIIYVAAIGSIPQEYYEAAEIDGASLWQKVRFILLPALRPLLLINFIGAFIGAFKAMENIFVLTGGGPLYRTHTVGLEVWNNAFVYLKFGYATAAAWIMGAMLIGMTLYQLLILKNTQFGGAKR